ncbi:MAG: ABC transporter permease subunit [Verrucomicrobiota bacterium]
MLLLTPSSYVASVLFLAIMALIYWTVIRGLTVVASETLPTTSYFRAFWLPSLFVVPLLTMRSVAEERRLGTLSTLLTTPATPLSLVLGKFLAVYVFYCGLWGLTLLFPFIFARVLPYATFDGRLIAWAPMVGGISFVALSGLLFIAVGIFSSSLTRSQLVSGMLTFTLLFLIIAFANLMQMMPLSWEESPFLGLLQEPLLYFKATQHLEDFSVGLIDTRPIFYYSSMCALLLSLAVINVESRS